MEGKRRNTNGEIRTPLDWGLESKGTRGCAGWKVREGEKGKRKEKEATGSVLGTYLPTYLPVRVLSQELRTLAGRRGARGREG